jgi:ribonucleotide monophosphatase NagD (HAD superfamily)
MTVPAEESAGKTLLVVVLKEIEHMFDSLVSVLHPLIGDTIGTDVYGAKVAGFDSALVVGRNVPEESLASDEAALGVRPDYYLVPG